MERDSGFGAEMFSGLERDHEGLTALMGRILNTNQESLEERSEWFLELRTAMKHHAELEQNVLYKKLTDYSTLRELAMESRREHHWLLRHLDVLDQMKLDDGGWMDQFIRLKENFDFHVCEEEGVIFGQIQDTLMPAELEALSEQVRLVRSSLAA